METLINFIISVVSSIIASVIYYIIMGNKLIDLLRWYPGILVILQVISISIIALLCGLCYRFIINFVEKNAFNKSDDYRIFRRKVFSYLAIMAYVGCILIIFGVFNRALTLHRDLFLSYGFAIGIYTHEVRVFLLWVNEYFLAITFGQILWNCIRGNKNILTMLKETSNKDVIYCFTSIAVLFLLLLF